MSGLAGQLHNDPATALRTRDFVTSFLPDFTKNLRAVIGKDDIKILQKLGDNLRKSGTCYSATTTVNQLFAIPNRIRLLIDRCRQANESDDRQDYFVIDALRNPFEVLYFKERFAPFYLMAINSPDDDRRTRLSNKNYTKAQIDAFDKKEYPEINKPLSGYEAFVSQNIQSCIERADIHINNRGTVAALEHTPDLKALAGYLVKYVSLIQHPGLVTPTRVERCMQAAYVAKLNSGCISRQVGAVVTDENYSIKSVGWNDVPLGQVPCLLRKAETIILEHDDKEAFSDYERKTSKFVEHIRKTFAEINSPQLKGRNVSFCFKDAYNSIHKSDNQVHTRSLHAEENAFLQISKHGGLGLQGGALFSTASPCELCAKKAYQIGIKTIYYIDPYPGISVTHILASGKHRPTMELFVGAIGEAYHRLYTPILPYKDELTALLKKDDPPE